MLKDSKDMFIYALQWKALKWSKVNESFGKVCITELPKFVKIFKMYLRVWLGP